VTETVTLVSLPSSETQASVRIEPLNSTATAALRHTTVATPLSLYTTSSTPAFGLPLSTLTACNFLVLSFGVNSNSVRQSRQCFSGLNHTFLRFHSSSICFRYLLSRSFRIHLSRHDATSKPRTKGFIVRLVMIHVLLVGVPFVD
jgi:hypothetical protein